MNREIKFRIWDKNKNKMFYEGNGDIEPTWKLHNKDYGEYCGYEIELMQYTGLKDKNGQEIYEGDIVEHTHFAENGTHKTTVVIGNEYCNFIDCGFLKGDSITEIKEPINEIIGNIYENNDLLKS